MMRTPNLLIEKLPDTITVCGEEVAIRTSYRRGLQASRVLDSGVEIAPALVLGYFFAEKDLVASKEWVEEAFTIVIEWWMQCGRRLTPHQKALAKREKRRRWDWDEDADAVLADFRHYYRIDLTKDKNMHWWVFRAFFDNLPPESESRNRIYYRGEMPSGMDAEKQRTWREIARNYRLKEA